MSLKEICVEHKILCTFSNVMNEQSMGTINQLNNNNAYDDRTRFEVMS
jgi:hypothetical protein